MKKLLLGSAGSPAALMLIASSRLFAAQGDWDTTFGGSGRVTTHVGAAYLSNAGNALAIQNDGKILLAGYSGYASRTADFAVLRYNTDGTLDSSFNATGYVTTETSDWTDYAHSVAIQKDGKLLVAGTPSLVRYNSDGSLDSSFNSSGIVLTNLGETKSVAVQADGKILLAGSRSIYVPVGLESEFAVARYHPDGSLDTAFGSGGVVLTDFGSGDYGKSMAVQSDGKIIVAGESFTWRVSRVIAVARYSPDGTLDTSFNASGKLMIDLPRGWSSASGVTLQSDGKILVAGQTGDNPGEDFAIVRLNRDGSFDTGFSGDGVVTTDFGGSEIATSIAVQPSGRFVVAGIATQRGSALARYNPDGTLDTTFRGTGKVVSNSIAWNAVGIQRDGNIVAGGYDTGGFCVGRYFGEPPPAIRIEHPGGERVAIPVSFGEVVPGGTVSRTLILRNTGSTTLTGLSATLSATAGQDGFTFEPLEETSLAPGTAMDFTAAFSPTAPGLRTATLVIASSDATQNPVEISLEGSLEGTQSAMQEIVIEQPAGVSLTSGDAVPVNFGPVADGTSRELTFTVRNTGGTLLTGLAVTTGSPSQFLVGPLTPLGQSALPPLSAATFTVSFSPAGADPATATLLITSNDEDENPFEIILSGALATGLEAWRYANFGSAFNTGPGADLHDADADGMLNLLEFALGTDPNASTVQPGTVVVNGTRLEFSYARPTAALAEVGHRLEWSESLSGTWMAIESTTVISSDDGITQQVTLGVPAGPLGRRFVRLRVTKL